MVNLLGTLILPFVRVPRCHNCSSKLCLLFGPCETRSPRQRHLRARQKKSRCEVVGNHHFSQGDPVLCCVWEELAFVIVDLTFHGRWHIFRVRCQPQCSSRFARLGSHSTLATRTGATVEVAKARCHYYSYHWRTKMATAKAVQESQLWESHQLARPKMVLSRDDVVQKR